MEIPTLRTERLILRPHRPEDFEAFAAMCADLEVMRYIAEVQDRDTAFRSFCATFGHWQVRGYGFWAVEEVATGALLGRVGLVRWDGHPAVEVGYALRRTAWGKGYATEAVRASLGYAHGVVGARGVISLIHPDNAPSIKVAERVGARYVREHMVKKEALRLYLHRDP